MSNVAAAMEKDDRFVTDDQVPDAKGLLSIMAKTAAYQNFTSPKYEAFIKSDVGLALLSSARAKAIKSLNEAISSTRVADTNARRR